MNILELLAATLLVGLTASGQTDPGGSSTDSLGDVFPLAIGRQWIYGYDYEYRDIGGVVDLYSDTGNVELLVISNVATPDSIIWKVREVGRHWTKTNASPWSGPSTEAKTFEIVELQQDKHRLYRTDEPSQITRSVLPFLSDLADTARIYRYAIVDSAGITRIGSYEKPHVPVFSFTFTRDVGLSSVFMSDGCMCIPWYWTTHSLRSTTLTGVANPIEKSPLQNYLLDQNYPNPFNPSTTIKYELPKSSVVRLSVYDMLGREVSVLMDERREAGVHEVKFDGSNLSSGVYFYRLQDGNFVQTRKFLLLR